MNLTTILKMIHILRGVCTKLPTNEIIKIIAPLLVDNPNTPDPNGATPVQHIKMYGSGQHSDIIEILTSFTDNLQ